ncbi:CMT1A duplicated region transcript 4 protein [Saccopteryx leptura]|uniref:CMT1A duplicated region transcript 4 protein n=1 Tax=Saccopteryx leptura TaxID=249018 RepID=UPI00339CE98A
MWTRDVKSPLTMSRVPDARSLKTREEATGNIGLPPKLVERHDPWPAYVTYVSRTVELLVDHLRAREPGCTCALEQRQHPPAQTGSPSVAQPKRKKSSRSSGRTTFRDKKSGPRLSVCGSFSASPASPTAFLEVIRFHTDAGEGPTANYNRVIFARAPTTRLAPHSACPAGEEIQASP